jgi:hypothetical protein
MGSSAMAFDKPLFDLISRLAYGRSVNSADIGNSLGVSLSRSAEMSNSVSTVYVGNSPRGVPAIQSVMLRLKNDAAEPQPNLVALLLDQEGPCIGAGEVISTYGPASDIDIPPPEQPLSVPELYWYRYDKVSLGFAFAREGQPCLQSIRIEY